MASDQLLVSRFPKNFPHLLDVSIHKPTTTPHEIKEMCEIGLREGFNVVSNSCYTSFVRQCVGKSAIIEVDATVGFPFGTASTIAKVAEAQQALKDGATEIDMVMAIGLLKEGPEYYSAVLKDIKAVVDTVHQAGGKGTKVIIETCYLTEAEKEVACKLVTEAGAEFVKTSTGYGTGGATLEDVRLMRKVSGPQVRVKAAGGIRTLEQCLALLEAGATRLGIGLTGALAILNEAHRLASLS